MTIKEMTELYEKMYGSEVTFYFVQYGEIHPTRSTKEGEKVKIEEAIGLLKHHYGEQFDIAIEAMEKQVMKEPKFSVKANSLVCPTCGHSVASHYCPNCGQRLGWNEEAEE